MIWPLVGYLFLELHHRFVTATDVKDWKELHIVFVTIG